MNEDTRELESFYDSIDADKAHELVTVPTGTEAQVAITNTKFAKDKNGNGYLMVYLTIVGEPFTKDITHFLWLPTGDDEKRDNQKLLAIRSFEKAFGITNQIRRDREQWKGLTAWAILKEVDSETEYGMQNTIMKWVRSGK